MTDQEMSYDVLLGAHYDVVSQGHTLEVRVDSPKKMKKLESTVYKMFDGCYRKHYGREMTMYVTPTGSVLQNTNEFSIILHFKVKDQ